jgi:hypothetical protein
MPIPARLRLPQPDPSAVEEMRALCKEVERAVIDDSDEVEALLARWNARASRTYEPVEFRTYYEAMRLDDFVNAALAPQPALVADLTYAEAREVVEAVMSATLPRVEMDYFVEWLLRNFPNAKTSDLVFWADEELTSDQVLEQAMDRSGRELPGAR